MRQSAAKSPTELWYRKHGFVDCVAASLMNVQLELVFANYNYWMKAMSQMQGQDNVTYIKDTYYL